MSTWIVPPIAGLIEPSVAPEYFIDGCGAIERFGDSVRFYLSAAQLPLESGGCEPHHVVMVKIVRPLRGLNRTAMQLMQCIDGEIVPECQRGPWTPRLVR